MDTIEQITKGLTLSKSLLLSSILIGEPYTGKLTLVRSIYPQALYVDAKETEALQHALTHHEEIVIYNFEAIKNLSSLDLQNKRIIAIANQILNMKMIEEHFAFIYHMPPLRERIDEVKTLAQTMSHHIKEELMLEGEISIDISKLDLTQNLKSFKISLYKEMIKKSLGPEDFEEMLYSYFLENMEGNSAYHRYLPLFEVPLIKAGLKKYRSQLKLSQILGLNRNTLRKKIQENDIH